MIFLNQELVAQNRMVLHSMMKGAKNDGIFSMFRVSNICFNHICKKNKIIKISNMAVFYIQLLFWFKGNLTLDACYKILLNLKFLLVGKGNFA